MDLIIGDQAIDRHSAIRSAAAASCGSKASAHSTTTIPSFCPISVSIRTRHLATVSNVPRPDDIGFDLFVGRFGNGVLQLALGGRAEIQDAVIVGDQSGSVGTLIIDGFDSFLQSGGFETDSDRS